MERLAHFEKTSKLKPVKPVLPYKPPQTLPRLLATTTANLSTPTSGGGGANKGGVSTETSAPRGTKASHGGTGRSTKEARPTVVSKIHQALTKPVQPVKPATPDLAVALAAPSAQQLTRQVQEVGGGSRHVTSVGSADGGGGETGGETVRGT